MAAEHQRKHVLFVVDYEGAGYVVFKVNLKDLFPDDDDPAPPPPPAVDMEMLQFPGPPIAFFREPEAFRGNIAFAVSGTTIVGLGRKRTFLHDTRYNSTRYGPVTDGYKYGALLLPVGAAAEIYALSIYPHFAQDARPHLEALTAQEPYPAWRALPEPPPELQQADPDLVGRMPVHFYSAF